MKTRSTFLKKAVPAALVLVGAAGLSSQANASAYAIAYNNIFGLNIISSPFVPLEDFNSFTATSSAGGSLNGVGSPFEQDSQGGPADATLAVAPGSVFGGAGPTDNGMTAQGQAGNYGYGDAQVSQTSIVQNPDGSIGLGAGPTQAWSIAESFVEDSGTAGAIGNNNSETGFDTSVTLNQATAFTFSFNADPYMEVEISSDALGYDANANLDVTITITDADTDKTVFVWSPDGEINGAGELGCDLGFGVVCGIEVADPFSLNGSKEVTAVGESAIFNPIGNGAPSDNIAPGSFGSFAAYTAFLPVGNYSISLEAAANSNVRTATPAPGILALMGLALAGLGFSRRKTQA